jgi:hypothetical protein
VIAIDGVGRSHDLLPAKLLGRAKGQASASSSTAGGDKLRKAEMAKRKAEFELRRRVDSKVLERWREQTIRSFVFSSSNEKRRGILNFLIEAALNQMHTDNLDAVARMFGAIDPKAADTEDHDVENAILKRVKGDGLDDANRLSMLMVLLAESEIDTVHRPENKKVEAMLGIDRKVIEKQVREEIADEQAAAAVPAPSSNGKPKKGSAGRPKLKVAASAARVAGEETLTVPRPAEVGHGTAGVYDAAHKRARDPGFKGIDHAKNKRRDRSIAGLGLDDVANAMLRSAAIETIGHLEEAIDGGQDVGLGNDTAKVRGLIKDFLADEPAIAGKKVPA